MKFLIYIISSSLLVSCATYITAPKVYSKVSGVNDYSKAIKGNINEQGLVNFKAISQNQEPLNLYINFIANHGLNSTPELFKDRNKLLAHYINSYNALSIFNVIESGFPDTNAGLKKVKFFVLNKFMIDGKRRSLRDYENNTIRKFGDPRVHFILNCMSIGCPLLPMSAVAPGGLNEFLEQATIKFFSEKRNLCLNHQNKTIHISSILDFFPEDFGGKDKIKDYVQKYSKEKLPEDYKIEYIPYDWTIIDMNKVSRVSVNPCQN